MQVEKGMILCHLLVHQDSLLSTLLMRELYLRIAFKDMNLPC